MADEKTTNWAAPRHVALLLLGTPAEHRGNFLIAIADELQNKGQHYTARLLRDAGEAYNRK
jgi:hypothetical protein